jgi:hypothetical protein
MRNYDQMLILCLSYSITTHSMFLEWWNTTKSLFNIWQHFSCLFDKGTAKICKNFSSNDSFLRADQGRGKIAVRLAGLAVLSCRYVAQKATVRFQFLAYFAIPSSSRHEKRFQKVEIHFVVIPHSRNIPCDCFKLSEFYRGLKTRLKETLVMGFSV